MTLIGGDLSVGVVGVVVVPRMVAPMLAAVVAEVVAAVVAAVVITGGVCCPWCCAIARMVARPPGLCGWLGCCRRCRRRWSTSLAPPPWWGRVGSTGGRSLPWPRLSV